MPDIKIEDNSFKVYYDKLYQQHPEVKFPIFQLPFQQNNLFTGREIQLNKISQYLSAQSTVAITSSNTSQTQTVVGLGGVGKTQLVIEYAYQAQAKNTYQIIWFLNGHNLDADYLMLAAQLKVYGDSKEEVIEQTKNKLQELGNYLLAIDDAEDYESVKDYLPKTSNNGHVIITTRHKNHWQQLLELDVFNLDEALQYFKQLINYDEVEREKVIYLIDILLGKLPLALTQAGAFIKLTNISVEKYIEYFEAQIQTLFGIEKKPEDYSDTIAVTWNITLNKIKETHPQAQDLLYGMSFLASGPSVIEQNWLSGVVENELDRREGLGELAIYSMIDEKNTGYTVHQLVQEVAFISMSVENKQKYLLKVYGRLKDVYPYKQDMQLEDYAQQRNLLLHLEKSLSRVEKSLMEFKQNQISADSQIKQIVNGAKLLQISLLILITDGYSNLGDISKKKLLLERALPILENHYGLEHPELATMLMNLGNACGALGDGLKKKEFLERALKIQENCYDANHPEVASTLANLGNAYGVLGDGLKKKEFLERALKIQEKHYGPSHLKVAIILANLGNAYGDLGDGLKKKEFLERALEIQESHYGSDHPQVAQTLMNLGAALGYLGDVLKEKGLLKRALKIQEKHYGPNHLQVVITLGNLGTAYGHLDKVFKKKAFLERALSILEDHNDDSNYLLLAKILVNLGAVYGDLGNALKAKDFFERALKIQENYYDSNHPEIAKTLVNLGTAYLALNNLLEAKKLLEHALKIQEKYYGFDHHELASALISLGIIYSDLRDAVGAKKLRQRVLKIEEKHYGSDHYELAEILVDLGNTYSDLSEVLKAKECYERALEIREKHYGLDHIKVAITLCYLGKMYGVSKDFVKKKALLERVLPIFEKHYGLDHPEVAKTLGDLGNTYGSLGNHQKKKMLLKRTLIIEEKHYGIDHPNVGGTLINLVNVYSQLEHWKKAKTTAERAYQILVTHPDAGPEHPHTKMAKQKLDAFNQFFSDPSIKQTTSVKASSSSSNNTSMPPKSSLQSEVVIDLGKQLRNAANQNNVELLSRLIQENKNLAINAQDAGQHQRSALHWAMLKLAIPCIKLLLLSGANIHLQDKSGNSSLDYALSSNNLEVLGLLLSCRYQLSLEAPFDFARLLRCAANKGEAKIIKVLLEKISNIIDMQDMGKHQRTALHWSVIGNHSECVKILLAAGARIDIQDIDRKTVLDYVAVSDSSGIHTLFTKSIKQTATSSQINPANFFTSVQTPKSEVNEDKKDTKPRRGFKNESHFKDILFKKLPTNLMLGTAYDQGDCFFDALAQCVNQINKTDVNTAKYLRMLCHEFYSKNKAEVDQWNIKDWGGVDRGKEDYYFVQYTAEECETLFQSRRTPVWGRSHIDGIILCRELNLKGLCIIEILEDPETKLPVVSFNLVAKDAFKAISEGEAQGWINNPNIPTLVVEQKSLHFVPLLFVEQVLEKTLVESLNDSFLPHASVMASEKKDERPQVTDQSSFKIYYDKLYQQYPKVKFPLFQLPFQRNKIFTGRESQLKQISEYLTTQNTLAITTCTISQTQTVAGLGGVGKTQLVIEYAYQAQAKNIYQVIWFFNGHNLDAEYLNFAAQLKIYGDNKEDIIEKTKNKLQKMGNYLLVIDDAENYESVKDYLPKTGNKGHVLITTRHKNHWQQMLELGVFNIDEALAYFKQLINYAEAEQDRVIYLVDIFLGRLPLALTQAGAFIKRTSISVEKYIEYFETQIKTLWGVEKKPEDYSDTIAVTWNITLSKIKETHPQSENLLCGMSFLAPAPNNIEESWLSGVVENELDRREGLGELVIYSMIDEQSVGYTVHQLVQEVVFTNLSPENKQNYLLKIYEKLKAIFPYTAGPQLKDYVVQRRLLPHLEKNLSRIDACLTIEKELELELLRFIANGHSNLGNPLKQKNLFERILNIQETHYGSDHRGVAITLVNLSNAYGALGDAIKQKALLERALPILEIYYGSNDPGVVSTSMNLGTAYGALGDTVKNKALLERALKIQETYYGSDHPEMAHTLMNLGNVYGDLGDAIKQKALLERALKIQETYYGSDDHPELAKTLESLGNAYGDLGDAVKKKALLERALPILETHYGSNHPEVARALVNLGNMLNVLGNTLKAKELLERALPILETYYGSDYLGVARTLVNLSNVYSALGDAMKKKEFLERALKIQETLYGSDHPEVARTLGNLGNAYAALGKTSKAKELLERALIIKEKHYGSNHLEVVRTAGNLAITYGDLGDILKEKVLLEHALKIQEAHYSFDHPDVAITLTNLAMTYLRLQQLKEAKTTAERAYQILLSHPNTGPQHPHTIKAKQALDLINQQFSNLLVKQVISTTASSFNSHSSSAPLKSSLENENVTELGKQLRNAANQNNVELLSKLIQENKNLDINAQDTGQHQRSALHWAVIKAAISCIKVLLPAGADIYLQDKGGKSTLDYAFELSDLMVLNLLLSHRYQLPLQGEIDIGKLLRRAAYEGDADVIQRLLEKWPNKINEKDQGKTERTALHWAVIRGHENCVKILLAAGADSSICDKENYSAIDWAGKFNHVAINQLFESKISPLSFLQSSTTFFQQSTFSSVDAWQKQIQVNEEKVGQTRKMQSGFSEDEIIVFSDSEEINPDQSVLDAENLSDTELLQSPRSS